MPYKTTLWGKKNNFGYSAEKLYSSYLGIFPKVIPQVKGYAQRIRDCNDEETNNARSRFWNHANVTRVGL